MEVAIAVGSKTLNKLLVVFEEDDELVFIRDSKLVDDAELIALLI